MNKALFLDRDNTIVHDVPYLSDPSKLVIMPGVIDTLCAFRDAGYLLIIITNQSGIGRGFFTETQLHAVNDRLEEMFKEHGINFKDILYCPHATEDNCSCRKPSPLMIEIAAKKYDISLSDSIMIGDKSSDIEAGLAAGCKMNILLSSEAGQYNHDNIMVIKDISQVNSFMLGEAPDVYLINKYLDGDCDAFDILYSRYKKQIYSYLNRLLSNQRNIIDDIFQQTWVHVIKKLPLYKDNQKFLAWMMRISHNLTIDYFRKHKNEFLTKHSDDNVIFSSSEAQPWHGLDREELGEALNKGISKLNTQQREVFLLRQEDISFNEIAEIQDVSINTALGRMQYAIKKLQKYLQEWKKLIDER